MNGNPYDVKTQPTLHAAFSTSKRPIEVNSIDLLLATIQRLDKVIGELQSNLVEEVCATYKDDYVYERGSMLFFLTDAVRVAAIQLEQIPADLRDDVERMVREAARR